jgi:hypothetical protein
MLSGRSFVAAHSSLATAPVRSGSLLVGDTSDPGVRPDPRRVRQHRAPRRPNGYDARMRLRSAALLVLVGCAPEPAPATVVTVTAPAETATTPPGSVARPTTTTTTPAVTAPASATAPAATASTPSSTPPPQAPEASERRPTAAETRECAARGGTIQPICMQGELACVVRYRDGGKRCRDKSDCRGECLYEGPDPAPPSATGICQRTSDPCGCKATIHQGHVEPTLCAD